MLCTIIIVINMVADALMCIVLYRKDGPIQHAGAVKIY